MPNLWTKGLSYSFLVFHNHESIYSYDNNNKKFTNHNLFTFFEYIHVARTKNLVSLPKMAVVFTILKNRTWSYQRWILVSVTLTKTVRHLSQCRIMSIILNIFQCLSKQNSHFIIHAYQVILNKWWKLIRVIRRNLKG